MNVFNRIFLVIYSLLWIAACAGLAVMAWNEGQMLDIAAGEFNLQAFIDSTGTDRWIFTAMMALLALSASSPWSRPSAGARPGRRASCASRPPTAASSKCRRRPSRPSSAPKIENIPGIGQAAPVVAAKGGIVETDITVSADPGASISDVTHVVNETTTRVLREQVGATQARRPTLHITYEEIAGPPRHGTRPQAPGAGTVPPPPPSRNDASASPPPEGESVPPPPETSRANAPLATGAPGTAAGGDDTVEIDPDRGGDHLGGDPPTSDDEEDRTRE
ncbi:MAG: hypothetical protein U5Q44_07275 [Dehalococcoidia bacterium]|nr:hypothetical protein [Dehalococcoidia bacterium]